jgi:GNAT superfamily N-acetyltransferase
MRLSPFGLIGELGLADATLYGFSRLLTAVTFGVVRLNKYYLTAQPIPAGNLTPDKRGRNIIISEASAQEALGTVMNRPMDVIRARQRSGCRCFLAHKNGELVGFQWFTMKDYLEDEVRCLFRLRQEDACAWDFDIFVRPEARTQPVFTKLWDATNAFLRDAEVKYSLSRISAFNALSLNSHARIGAWPFGWAVFVSAGEFQLTLLSARPWLKLSLDRRSVPVIEVSTLARASAVARHTAS